MLTHCCISPAPSAGRRTRNSLLAALSISALLIGGASCGGGGDGVTGPPAPPKAAGVTLSPALDTVLVSQSLQLTATVSDASGAVINSNGLVWRVDQSAVADVSALGMVSSKAPGSVTVTATVDGKVGSSLIVVRPVPVASVVVSPAAPTLYVGQSMQLIAAPRDSAGGELPSREVVWTSDDTSIATVSVSGAVTATKVGAVGIRATAEGKIGVAWLTIALVPVHSVAVNPAQLSVNSGRTFQLSAILRDSAGTELTKRAISWLSSDTTIASVSTSGLVTARAPGSATVTAVSEGRTGSAGIIVNPNPVASVAVSPASATLTVGSSQSLTAILKDASGNVIDGRVVTWTSSDQGKATVSPTGLVAATAPGLVTVSATSETKVGTANITVRAPAPSLTVSVTGVPQGTEATIVVWNASGGSFRDSTLLTATNTVASFGSLTPGTYCVQGDTLDVPPLRFAPTASICTTVQAASDAQALLAYVEHAPLTLTVNSMPSAGGSIDLNRSGQFVTTLMNVPHSQPIQVWLPLGAYEIVAKPITALSQTFVGAPAIQTISIVRGGATATPITYATAVSGAISANTTWTLANSPYRLTAKVQVAYGATLSVEPGVVVYGDDNTLEMFGDLAALGTASNKITFEGLNIVGGPNTTAAPSTIDIQFARISHGSLYAPPYGGGHYGSLTLRNSSVSDLGGGMMYIWYPVADCFIEQNTFVRSVGVSTGTDGDHHVYIRNNVFVDQTTGFAVENWASYQTSATVVELNSFLSTTRIALSLPRGYTSAYLNGANNFWNSSDPATIQGMIFDKSDDLAAAAVIPFQPFLLQADGNTPAYPPL